MRYDLLMSDMDWSVLYKYYTPEKLRKLCCTNALEEHQYNFLEISVSVESWLSDTYNGEMETNYVIIFCCSKCDLQSSVVVTDLYDESTSTFRLQQNKNDESSCKTRVMRKALE